ncbi:MAG: hypothetical protein CME63_16185 [Halobacteriovoraceae bacterium]|nr:hypothetical protein [Halobacteriovoraceae bacterium]|tara:strand:- start:70800 stop:71537 length:738 start_codon:yes stop_codon:yes gene_type:complete
MDTAKNILIVGAGHGIGLSFVTHLSQLYPHAQIFATYRNRDKANPLLNSQLKREHIFNIDPTVDEHIKKLATDLADIKLDIIINCVGLLHNKEGLAPEKSLKDFSTDNFLEVMRVNTVVTPLLAKYFHKKLNPTKSYFVTLSAKVGSIEDNRMGGWYAYRASKSALNMVIKNIAIEFQRKRNNCVVLAIHPGTTKTDLSAPFIERTNYILHTPDETAQNIVSLFHKMKVDDSGKFISWNGDELPW